MTNSDITARLDKLLEKVSGGAHVPPTTSMVPEGREVARVVKRTEVAGPAHKRNLVKYVVIGIAIVLLLAGIIFFVGKTSHGRKLGATLSAMMPFGSKKKRAAASPRAMVPGTGGGSSAPSGAPARRRLVAQDVDFRSNPSTPSGPPSQRPSTTVRVPRIPVLPQDEDDNDMDPGAVKFKRRRLTAPRPPPRPPRPVAPRGPSPPVDDVDPRHRRPRQLPAMINESDDDDDDLPPTPAGAAQRSRGPSPPIDDTGPAPPADLLKGYGT